MSLRNVLMVLLVMIPLVIAFVVKQPAIQFSVSGCVGLGLAVVLFSVANDGAGAGLDAQLTL